MKNIKNISSFVVYFVLFLLVDISMSQTLSAQDSLPYDTTYTFDHYKYRRAYYEGLPNNKNEIVFLGNSITERCHWSELFKNKNIVNRGIGGDVCWGLLNRLGEVLSSKPKKIFLMIGVNDVARNVPVEIISAKIEEVLRKIKVDSPKTKVYLQSVLPINEQILKYDYMKDKSDDIIKLNEKLKVVAENERISFVNLYPDFADSNGNLKAEYTVDGIHLSAAGYLLWRNVFAQKGIRL